MKKPSTCYFSFVKISYSFTCEYIKGKTVHCGASIMIPDNTPKSTISKVNGSFNIFQDHFYNKLQRSKMLLKYTIHLYEKQGHLTQVLLHKNEPLRWIWTCYPRVLKLSSCDLCMKIISKYVSYCEASITIRIVSWGDCIITALENIHIYSFWIYIDFTTCNTINEV